MSSKEFDQYHQSLAQRYGELMGARVLSTAIGYPSLAAMNMAVKRGTLRLETFSIDGRKGHHALTLDVARWLWNLKQVTANDGIDPINKTPGDPMNKS